MLYECGVVGAFCLENVVELKCVESLRRCFILPILRVFNRPFRLICLLLSEEYGRCIGKLQPKQVHLALSKPTTALSTVLKP